MLDILDDYYNLEEFRELCFDLSVDYDNLGGEGKRNKARELLLLIYRQNRLDELLAIVATDRPNTPLPDSATLHKQAKTWRKVSTRSERIRQTLVHNVRSVWIDGVLHRANDVLLSLDLAYTPDAIQRDIPVMLQGEAETETAVNQSLLEIFQEHGHRLLILGEPGSGKTFTLLQLADELLDLADQDLVNPIPVILNLSSWALARKPLPDWIAEEMLIQYQVARKITKTWLQDDELLLLLDGLDEVDELRRNDCLLAINTFMAEHQAELVVCSRIHDYQQLKDKLNVSTAVRIQPLTDDEISRYLNQPGLKLQSVLSTDSHLYELARSPLMLTVMTLAYQDLSEEELAPLDTPEERRQHLFSKYVEQVFKRRPLDELNDKVKWLAHLGNGMSQTRQSIFYIEKLQPAWLPSIRWYLALIWAISGFAFGVIWGFAAALRFGNHLGWIVMLSSGLILSLVMGLLVGLVAGPIGFLGSFVKDRRIRSITFFILILVVLTIIGYLYIELIDGIFVGLLLGLIGIILSFDLDVEPVEVLQFAIPPWRSWVTRFIFGAILGLGIWLTTAYGSKTAGTPLVAFVVTLLGGLCGLAIACVQPREIEQKMKPNQGIKSSAKNATYMLISGSILFGLAGGLANRLFYTPFGQQGDFAMLALWFGLPIIFLVYGGLTVIKHYTLRILLARQGTLPLNLDAFLETMSDRIILRKVGGGYIFIHRYLMEYFASLDDQHL